ncbi:thioester reductase domain-containing protein [Nocardia rhizosphaerae]|uniref:Thioester reductase domain-containing protein n=1 Tax=Nocardia rhizosphaerae TaxID=1691571 RepID=A0ABV8LBM0_9NOCA
MTTESLNRPATPGGADREDIVRRALLELRSTKRELARARAQLTEPIAIIGIGCRFPGGVVGPDEFWDLLASAGSGICEVPADRWDLDAIFDPDPAAAGRTYSRHGGFLDSVAAFDAGLFGISAREAEAMDPQHRLVLEVGWSALEHAGIAPDSLRGSATGVFVGMGPSDYAYAGLSATGLGGVDAYAATGNAANFGANRLSYALGLGGPSVVVDTACSSSLVALHLACASLRSGESDLALVGGVNVMVSPATTMALSKARMLSVSGQCRTFDAGADGYVRGEGCGVVVLKRVSAAVSDGDRILAVVKGTAVNQDGRSAGITVPNGRAQQEVVRAALRRAGVTGGEVGYVEAHGTGTPLGDPIEVRALAAVLGAGRPMDDPVVIGSVKTNIGHLEAAAGIAGLIKTALIMDRAMIPAQRNLVALNPHVDWASLPVRVVAESTGWTGDERIAGVSSFGFGGTNAHAVLAAAPAPAEPRPVSSTPKPVVVKLAGNTEAAVADSARLLAGFLDRHAELGPAEVAWTADTGRADLPERTAVVAATRTELLAGLRAVAAGEPGSAVLSGRRTDAPPRIAFNIADGPGHRAGVLGGVYGHDPAATAAADSVAEATGFPLEVLLSDTAEHRRRIAEPDVDRLACYLISVALGAWWRARGIEPELVIGSGIGEYAAGAVAGVFSVADGARLVDGRATDPDTAALELRPPAVDLVLADRPGLDPAHFTSPAFWAALDPAPAGSDQPSIGAIVEEPTLVIDLGAATRPTGGERVHVASLDGADPARALAAAVATVWCAGAAIDWRVATARPARPVGLPTYPFQRQRYWPIGSAQTPVLSERPLCPRFTALATGGLVAETTLSVANLPFLVEHLVHGEYVVPGVVFIELILRVGAQQLGADVGIDSLQLHRPLVLRPAAVATVQISVTGTGGDSTVAVYSRGTDGGWHQHVTAAVSAVVDTSSVRLPRLGEPDPARPTRTFDTTAFYADFWHPRFRLGPSFQLIDDARGGLGHATATFTPPGPGTRGVAAGVRPELLLLDAAVQLVALAADDPGAAPSPDRPLRLGTGYRRMAMRTSTPTGQVRATARAETGPNGQIVGDVVLYDADGTALGYLEGVSFAQVGPAMLDRMAAAVHTGDAPAVAKPRMDTGELARLARTERVARTLGFLRAALAGITKNSEDTFAPTESLVERLDSLMLIELKDRVEYGFSLELDTETMFDAGSLDGLAGWIADQFPTAPQVREPDAPSAASAPTRRRGRSRIMTVDQMSAKAQLPPEITATGPTDPDAPAATLLTGATGFVGAHLLDELLTTTDDLVICLVRADDELHAGERIVANLTKYGLDATTHRDRIVPLVGDLAQPRFGLSDAAFTAVHGMIGQILHCGGMVKWTYPYDGLASANVDGTVEVLRLATLAAPRPVHFISTVGVFSSRSYTAETVTETAELDTSGPLAVGYAQSKWVAEKLVRIAYERGVPTTIHRINTGGDSATGAFNRQDHLSLMIKGCVEAAIAPISAPMPLQPAPIDYVARGIVALTRAEAAIGGTYHLVHPQQLGWTELFDHLAEYGFPCTAMPFDQWRERVVNRRAGTMALVGLTPFLHESVDDVRLPFSESALTRSILEPLGIVCPPLDRALIHRYLDAFVAAGFVPAPTQR